MSSPEELYAVCALDHPRPDCCLVRIAGELDATSAPRVEEEINSYLSDGCNQVVLDLEGLRFIDSIGIRTVLQVLLQKKVGETVIVNPRPGMARKALEIVGVTRAFPVVEQLDDALAKGCRAHSDGA